MKSNLKTLPIQAKGTTQNILNNQLDTILNLLKCKQKGLDSITKAHPKLIKQILDCASGKTELTPQQLKAIQMALVLSDNLEKGLKESEQIMKALEQATIESELGNNAPPQTPSQHVRPPKPMLTVAQLLAMDEDA